MKFKSFLAYGNPLLWIVALPVGIGIFLGVVSYGATKNTGKVVCSIVNDIEDN